MIGPAKCPTCTDVVHSFDFKAVEGSVLLGTKWNCIALCCPKCNTVLGAQIDPIAIKTDTINGLMERLRK